MFVSVSRRTDIPAFYAPWFMGRVREGFCLVPNPYDARRFSRVPLSPREAELILFWSKNPAPLLPCLDELDARGYAYAFTFTLTPYGPELEPGLPDAGARVETFERLSQRLGPLRVDWRYDPVLLDARFTVSYHEERFARLCERLAPLTTRCIFSFADPYPHLHGRVRPAPEGDMRALAAALARIGSAHGLALETCCERIDLSDLGIAHGACVDAGRAARIFGRPVSAAHDAGQRPGCGCVRSVDIGAYDTCPGGCAYCYATHAAARARARYAAHDPAAPSLTGPLPPGARVDERAMPPLCEAQTRLPL